MAAGTFILRPSADISLRHSLAPDSSAAAYLLINESVCDESSTYIYDLYSSGSSSDITGTTNDASKFALSGNLPSGIPIEKMSITKATAHFVHGLYGAGSATTGGSTKITLESNGSSETSGTFSISEDGAGVWFYESAAFSSILNTINNYIKSNKAFPELTVTVTNSCTYNSKSSYPTASIAVSQVYIELEYEEITGLNIHHKNNGVWAQAQAAYQKQNGTWVEITEDQAKSILQNSFCIKQ